MWHNLVFTRANLSTEGMLLAGVLQEDADSIRKELHNGMALCLLSWLCVLFMNQLYDSL